MDKKGKKKKENEGKQRGEKEWKPDRIGRKEEEKGEFFRRFGISTVEAR